MKSVLLWASILPYGLALDAQITVVLNRVPSTHQLVGKILTPEITVRNNSSVSLAAFAIRMEPVDPNTASFVRFFDSAVDETDDNKIPDPKYRVATFAVETIVPGQQYRVPVPTRVHAGQRPQDLFKAPIISAGVYVDGTTTGDGNLLRRLIARRFNMLQAIELTSDLLSHAGQHNTSRGQLIEQFQSLADSVHHWYLPLEQQVGYGLYQSIVEKLIALPPLQLGEPFPPTRFVQQETDALRHQRSTIIESQPGLNVADASAPFQ